MRDGKYYYKRIMIGFINDWLRRFICVVQNCIFNIIYNDNKKHSLHLKQQNTVYVHPKIK